MGELRQTLGVTTTNLRLFRFNTKVLAKHKPVPAAFQDWYEGLTLEEARADYDEDLHRYGLSCEQIITTITECDYQTQQPL